MIPLSRRAAHKRLETTLLSYSRQSLPRPARLYSTPTNRANAQAFDLSASGTPSQLPDFIPATTKHAANLHEDPSTSDMDSFLRIRTPFTVLPTPLPQDRYSAENDYYFAGSSTRDIVAVMDACLHNGYDVPRAKLIFDKLR
ncbi:hypothetical protein FA95DRAFT_1454889, partial [Auriscalpium vulgare]